MLELNKPVKAYACKVRTIAAELDEKDSKTFLQAVNDTSWSPFLLMKELKANGLMISDRTIRTHRSGVCSCSKI